MSLASCGDQTRGCSKTCQSSIFVHRFVGLVWWGWNAFNLSVLIDLFFTHESFYFSFCLFPLFHLRHSLFAKCSKLFLSNVVCCACSSKLKDLNYDNFCIQNVRYNLTIFNGDVLFELPPIITLGRCKEWKGPLHHNASFTTTYKTEFVLI
jgi:hypothetical protein